VAEAARKPEHCGYGPMNGELSMREALVEEMKVVYGQGADILHDDVSLTAGCNMSFVAVAMTLAEPGDEVILPLPWFVIPFHLRCILCSTHTYQVLQSSVKIPFTLVPLI
jgi:aspartate/methionine/tyrosine aminotransferase